MFEILNAALSAGLAVLTAIAIMSPKFKDGVLVKLGLIMVCLGCIGGFSAFLEHKTGAVAEIHSLFLGGVFLCSVGYVWRTRRGTARRLSDWIETQT